MAAISTHANTNVLTIRDVLAASQLMLATRNSKGRPMPLHLQGPPGGGKSMLMKLVAKQMARSMPGVPVGFILFNPGVSPPSDVPGFVLFDKITHPEGHPLAGQSERISTYTRPAMFAVTQAFIADSQGNVESITADYTGQPLYIGSMVKTPTGLQALVFGFTILDEYMQADPEIRKILAPLLDEGRIATHSLPDTWAVWAASNRAKDQSGVGKAMAFLTNRVATVELIPDFDALRAYGAGADMLSATLPVPPLRTTPSKVWHPCVLAFMDQYMDTIFQGTPADPAQPFLTPRSLEAMANLFDVTLVDDHGMVLRHDDSDLSDESAEIAARHRLFLALAAGMVGPDNAEQFNAIVDLWGTIPTIAEIMAAPKTAVMPDKKDAQLIAAWQCANAMTLRNGSALMEYMGRREMSDAFRANTIINAVTRDGELLQVPAIAKYFATNTTAMQRMVSARNAAGRAARGQR